MKRFSLQMQLCLGSMMSIGLFCAIANAQDDLAEKVSVMLEKNCGKCHVGKADCGIDYINDLKTLREEELIVPGDLEESPIWEAMNRGMDDDPMPPADETQRPSGEDLANLKTYILQLGDKPDQPEEAKKEESKPAEPEETRDKKITQLMVVHAIHDYLSNVEIEDRKFKRFFTLNTIHNLPTKKQNARFGVDNSYLGLVRAATSKTLNSLTWAPNIVVPEAIGPNETVMVFDMRDVEWDENRSMGRPDLWKIMVQGYPYGMKHDLYPDDLSTQSKSEEIYEWTGVDIPWVRADWFISTATQPHIYHALLYDAVKEPLRMRKPKTVKHADGIERPEQPMNASDLYGWLNVDVAGNLRRGRAARAAFTRSGVSSQNRMIERHPALYGYIWPSYDFIKGGERMNLAVQPLGPDGIFDKEFAKYSFEHDGGEMIFGLPNGLQGFLLVNGKGDRIPFGPPEVVFDKSALIGNGMIVNGVSCIKCHKNGLITHFNDSVKLGREGFSSKARKLIDKLFLDREKLDVLIDRDQARYRAAMIESVEAFLPEAKIAKWKADKKVSLTDPINPIANRFLTFQINATVMASELGVSEEELKAAIKYNPRLQDLGLMVVANGGTFNRETWQSGKGLSIYQKVVQIMKLGTPTSVQAPPWRGR